MLRANAAIGAILLISPPPPDVKLSEGVVTAFVYFEAWLVVLRSKFDAPSSQISVSKVVYGRMLLALRGGRVSNFQKALRNNT